MLGPCRHGICIPRDPSFRCRGARAVRIGGAPSVRIRHPRGHGPRPMSADHRSHISRREAGDPSARGNSQLRRAVPAGQSGRRSRSLRAHREQLPISIARDSKGHSRHVVGNIKRTLPPAGLHRAVGDRLRLIGASLHIEPPTVSRSGSGIFLQLLLHGVGGLGRRSRIRSRGRRRLAASSETGKCEN